jgi:hypothetical protein
MAWWALVVALVGWPVVLILFVLVFSAAGAVVWTWRMRRAAQTGMNYRNP